MNILIINGSPREDSRNRGVTYYVSEILKEKGIIFTLFDKEISQLPVYNGKNDSHEIVKQLETLVTNADGFFISTPEYHNGVSGALKNMFDFLGNEQFQHKPMSITSAVSGGKGGINALNNLRIIGRGVYANVLPSQMIFDGPMFDHSFQLINEEAKKRLHIMVEELIVYAEFYEKQFKKKINRNQ